jgi:AhpD family alkylhydroperoxidase
MEPRIDARRDAQEAQKAMHAIEKYLAESGLDQSLIHLMKVRASQINGCAYCIDMHSKDARALVSITRALTYNPPKYATNRMAKIPSMIPMAVITTVRFIGPKKISATMTTFSITEAVKIGTRVAGLYAL